MATKKVMALRREMVLNYLTVPRTIMDVAEFLGVSYHTARKCIMELEEQSFIRIESIHRNQACYKAVVHNERPTIPIIAAGKAGRDEDGNLLVGSSAPTINAADLVKHYVNPENMEAYAAVRDFPVTLAKLLYAATLFMDPHQRESATQVVHLLKIKLQSDLETLENFVDILQQVIRDPAWWNEASLLAMVNDARYDYAMYKEIWESNNV